MLFGYCRLKEAYEAHGVRFGGKTGVHVEEKQSKARGPEGCPGPRAARVHVNADKLL